MQTVTVLDVETGGLDREKNPITEVALLNYSPDTFIVEEEYNVFVKPYGGLIVDPISLKKSMVTLKDIENGLDAKKLVNHLITLFKKFNPTGRDQHKTILCGHNVTFDIEMLEVLFLLHGKDLWDYISKEKIDTLTKAKEAWPKDAKHNLEFVCNKIGYKLVGAHSAMNDVRATYYLNKYFVGLTQKSSSGKQEETQQTIKRRVFQF